jgi:hypothetical protein
VGAVFAGFEAPWWIAGGYAIELAVGRAVRNHRDVDVLVLRPDQLKVQEALFGWDLFAADPPGTLRPWRNGEILPTDVHDVWCRSNPESPWRIQVMLDDATDSEWVFRRNPAIHRPIAELGTISDDGIPYVAPEVQLLYKAQQPRAKDEADFTAVLPVLVAEQRNWLSSAIQVCYGIDHPWQSLLAD